MSLTFHAQEIEENQINENKEALLRKNSLGNEANENAIKKKLNTESIDPIFSVNDNSSAFLPRNAFSYTKNYDIAKKPKPPLFPKPRDRQRVNLNEIVDLATNMQHTGVEIDSKQIRMSTPYLISKLLNDSQIIDQPNDSSKCKSHRSEDYIKLDVTETGPPPLPSRPPPILKYPLGIFYKEEENLNKVRKEHQIKSSQNKFCQSDQIEKLINKNEKISETVTSSENQRNKLLPELEVKNDVWKSFSQETNSLVIQQKVIGALGETEEAPKPFLAGPKANKRAQKSISPSNFQKRSISLPLESHENKHPQPLLRPEANRSDQKLTVHCNANSSFHQRLEQLLIEQSTNEQKCLTPVNRLMQPVEGRLEEFSKDDSVDISRSTIQKNISPSSKMSLKNSKQSEIHKSFIPKPKNSLNSKFENIRMDPSSSELRDEQGRMDLNQGHTADFSFFHSLNRPSLPQKIKSTQRSLSYTSLVQTVKDFSTTIWNSSDKSKRSSTGMTSKVTEVVIKKKETEITASDGTIWKIQSSFEEEKNAVVRSSWFHDVSATEAQHRLLKLNQDGAFLIRPTSHPTDLIQYTASITYAGRVFNIHIRRKANFSFALGKEKEGEKSFLRMSDLIKYYQDVPFDIHPAGNSSPHAICFRVTPPH